MKHLLSYIIILIGASVAPIAFASTDDHVIRFLVTLFGWLSIYSGYLMFREMVDHNTE